MTSTAHRYGIPPPFEERPLSDYGEPFRKLAAAYAQWERRVNPNRMAGGFMAWPSRSVAYDLATAYLEGLSFPAALPEEVVSSRPLHENLASFLSAAWNRAQDKVIFYPTTDGPRPQDLGYRLARDRVLVVPASTELRSRGFGSRCDGSLIIEGSVQTVSPGTCQGVVAIPGAVGKLGEVANGLTVITGSVGDIKFARAGLTLDLRTAPAIYRGNKKVLGPRDIDAAPGLRAYLEELAEPFRPGKPLEGMVSAVQQLDRATVRNRIRTLRGSLRKRSQWI